MFDIRKFDAYREDNRREVKRARDGLPHSLWETYSSFANCAGGVIILGVEENNDGSWRATGLTNEAKLRKDFWDTVNNPTKVSVNLLMDKDLVSYETEDGKVILVIYVPAARREQKPVYINDDLMSGTFRRNWEGDYHCRESEVRAMLRDAPEETGDMKVLEDMALSDLNAETVHAYRRRHMALHPDHVWEKLSDEEYLEQIGAARRSRQDKCLHPTGAGLLMFGNEYKILYEYPEYFLDYREMLDPTIRWTDRVQSSSGDWSGNLFDFYFRVYGRLAKDVKVPFKLDGIIRIDDTPVHRALREALANCLVNTDFFVPRGVVIRKDAEVIVMENPGSIRTGKEQMLRGGISDPRNKAIMKMLNLIGIGERAGSGVPDIYSIWESAGWMSPTVEEQYGPDRTIVTLPIKSRAEAKNGDKKTAIKNGDKKTAIKNGDKISARTQMQLERVRMFMAKGKMYTAEEIGDFLGLKASRTRVILSLLVQSGAVDIYGENRNRRYMISAEGESKTE